ncbi:MAG: CDP-alcohol phosphatidyltransferase family protein [Rickettsiales bacterium]|jgi:CDP-diacylglycerol--glycerol-3-phosphate 3-phosphatidyltransferase|nr:CDP-alcohol phosphatidyltransferase family protein [Rickettsiales bacterium]
MKTFVNLLSIFRIVASFALVPTLMLRLYWLSFVLFALAGFSDYFDGWLARKYNAVSKLGGVLDQIGDKFLAVFSLILLAIMMPVWFVIVPVIVMVGRELYVSGLREFLGTQKIEMPVPKNRFAVAKVKTTFQLVSIGAFFLVFALGASITPETTNRAVFYGIYALPFIGMWGLWLSLVASVWSATEYTTDFAKKMKSLKK